MMDKILNELNASTMKLIDDVKMRATSIVESAVNLSIDGGKKRLDDLREMLKSEADMLEQRIKILKNTSMADIDQRSNDFSQKIQEIHQKLTTEKNEINNLLNGAESQLKKISNEISSNIEKIFEQKQKEIISELINVHNEWLSKVEKEFEAKLDDVILKNRGEIIKSIIKSIFSRRKT